MFINLFRLFFLVNCGAGLVALRIGAASRSDLKLLKVVHNWSLGCLNAMVARAGEGALVGVVLGVGLVWWSCTFVFCWAHPCTQ